MDDQEKIARLRENRRRRILENSEERLSRITSGNKNRTPEIDENSLAQNSSSSESYLSNDPISKSLNENYLTGFENSDDFTNIQSPNFSCNPQMESSTNGSLNVPSSSETYAFPKKVSDAETRSFGRRRSDARRNSTCTQMMMETLNISSFSLISFRPLLVVVLAFSIKACFLLTNNFLLNETIFLPFLILEVVIYAWTKYDTQVYVKPLVQSLIPGVLLLCGVPLSFINSCSSIWSDIQYLIQDFTVYLFSFVFSRFLCENYLL